MNLTIQAYETSNWLEWRLMQVLKRTAERQPPFWETELLKFLELGASGDLFEIGVGPGVEAKALLETGVFTYYLGLEPAGKIARYAQAFLKESGFGSALVLQKTLEDFCTTAEFDAVLSISSLIHIKEIDIALDKIRKLCSKNALCMFVLNENSPRVKSHVSRDGMVFYYYTFYNFVTRLQKSGFTVLDCSSRITRAGRGWQVFYVKPR